MPALIHLNEVEAALEQRAYICPSRRPSALDIYVLFLCFPFLQLTGLANYNALHMIASVANGFSMFYSMFSASASGSIDPTVTDAGANIVRHFSLSRKSD